MENQTNVPVENNMDDIPRGLLKIAIEECGLMSLVCVGFCIVIGAGVGGLVGYKCFIDTRN